MIRDLQDAKMGDPRRLAYIMERIESDHPVYNSDERYVREKFRQLREEIIQKSDDFERIDAPPPEAPNTTPRTPTIDFPQGKQGVVSASCLSGHIGGSGRFCGIGENATGAWRTRILDWELDSRCCLSYQ